MMSNRAGNIKKEERLLQSRCILQFRPHNGYKGEYGFDWLRKADENIKTVNGLNGNDWNNREILGKYINTGYAKNGCEQRVRTKKRILKKSYKMNY